MSLLGPNLEAFLAIVKRKTVMAAADDIGITQTGVTQRIRALESQLKATLFTRSRKGMILTQEGQALLRYCSTVKEMEGAAISQIQGGALTAEVQISITGPTSILSSRIVSQCLPLAKEFPQLLFEFIINDLEERIDSLKMGKSQFAILEPNQVPNETDSKLLKPEKYILVASPQWRSRRLKDILETERAIDFDPSDQTTLLYLKSQKLNEKIQSSRHFVNNNQALIQMISNGVGYGTLTIDVAKRFLESEELIVLNGGAVFERNLALVWYPRPEIPKYFKSFITAIK